VDHRGPLRRTREQVLLAQLQSNPPPTQEQAIEEDKGIDLIERLGKIDAFHAKEEQRVKTAKFLEHFDTVRKAPELSRFQPQVESIYQIAKLFYSSS
jgi:hypothetical protein